METGQPIKEAHKPSPGLVRQIRRQTMSNSNTASTPEILPFAEFIERLRADAEAVLGTTQSVLFSYTHGNPVVLVPEGVNGTGQPAGDDCSELCGAFAGKKTGIILTGELPLSMVRAINEALAANPANTWRFAFRQDKGVIRYRKDADAESLFGQYSMIGGDGEILPAGYNADGIPVTCY